MTENIIESTRGKWEFQSSDTDDALRIGVENIPGGNKQGLMEALQADGLKPRAKKDLTTIGMLRVSERIVYFDKRGAYEFSQKHPQILGEKICELIKEAYQKGQPKTR